MRSLLTLAARNILRQRARTGLTLAAIAFGVAALIVSGGFVLDLFDQFAESLIHSQSGHLQVGRHGYFVRGAAGPQEQLIRNSAATHALLRSDPRVAASVGRLGFSGLLSNGRADLPIVAEGVEPAGEVQLGSSLRMISGRALQDRDDDGMLIGQGVAQALKLAPGDRGTLLATTVDGAMNSLDFRIVGVFQTISREYDAHAVRMLLPVAQDLLQTADVNVIVVLLAQTADTDAAAQAFAAPLAQQGLETWTWRALNDFYEKTVELYERQFAVLRILILLMVLLGVANSVNMTAHERLAEFGTMRALGNTSRQVFTLVVCENLLLGLAGAALGAALGVALAWLISVPGIPMPPPPNANVGYLARIRPDAAIVASSAAIGLVAPVLAALWPALRVARVPVIDALRSAE
jgi:putative ABC transport system permease protein